MRRRWSLGPLVAVLSLALFVSACGGSSKPQASSSGPAGPATPQPYALFKWTPVMDYGGALDARARTGGYVDVTLTGWGVGFSVFSQPWPNPGSKVAAFRCHVFEFPLLRGKRMREVPTRVTVVAHDVGKTYEVRPAKPVGPGQYRLVYSGSGWFDMSVYELVQV
jgi:hypothetical protein